MSYKENLQWEQEELTKEQEQIKKLMEEKSSIDSKEIKSH